MKILFACKEFPHAKIIGGPIIIYNRIKYLSRRHIVSLAAFIKEEDRKYIPTVKPLCHDLRLIPLPPKRPILKRMQDFFTSPIPPYFLRVHSSKKMAETIAEMVQKDQYDFVIAEYSVMGQFIHNNPHLLPIRRIISVHECYYLARRKDFHHHRFGVKKIRELLNLKGLKKYEFNMYHDADRILTLTPQGKQELLKICPELDISVVPHGVDVEYFSFTDLRKSEESIVFVGNYLHYPNADAVSYFIQQIWPRLKSLLPGVKFYVVGQSPPPEIYQLAQDKDIIITGKVDDVRPYLRKSRIFICPVRLGGGFRGKILEAMSIGRPIVSTSLGAEGIPARNRDNIILADKPEDFANGIFDLMSDHALFQKIIENALKLVTARYSWEKGVDVLEEVLEKMMVNFPFSNNPNMEA
ncbi:glycosyltransferase [Acidobacteriota bacterium]